MLLIILAIEIKKLLITGSIILVIIDFAKFIISIDDCLNNLENFDKNFFILTFIQYMISGMSLCPGLFALVIKSIPESGFAISMIFQWIIAFAVNNPSYYNTITSEKIIPLWFTVFFLGTSISVNMYKCRLWHLHG